MIDWKRKLTSRKFWAAAVGLVGAVLAYCGAEESVVTQVTAIIMAGATLIAYIIGEGLVDANREKETVQIAEAEPAEPEIDTYGEGL